MKPISRKALFASLDPEDKILTLKGKAYFANVHSPNPSTFKKFGKKVFNLTLGFTDEEELNKAKSIGMLIKEPNEYVPHPHITIKRTVKDTNMDNPDLDKPELVDSMQNPIPKSILIGNGSDVCVRFGTFWYEAQGGGIGTSLWKVKVIDLVPYEGKASDDPMNSIEEGGFTVTPKQGLEEGEDVTPF